MTRAAHPPGNAKLEDRLARFGPIAMVAGYGAVGVSAFAMLAAGPRVMGTDGYSSLALTWTVVTILGIGIAAPGEQTITRGIAAGTDTGVVVAVGRRLAVLPPLVAVGMPIALTMLRSTLGDPWLWVSTIAAAALGWALLACVRGVLGGRHRFAAYAVTLFTEAAVRILLVLLAALIPQWGQEALALSVFVPLLASSAAGWLFLGRRRAHLGETVAEDSRSEQGSITAVSLLGQICLSTAPLWLSWQSTDAAIAGAFVSATSYMRIPLLLAGGLYAPILAKGAQAYAVGDRKGVARQTLRGALVGAGGSAGLTVLLLVMSGPALHLLYGPEIGISLSVLCWLGATTVASVAANVLTQVLYACQRAPSAALAWVPPALATTASLYLAAGSVEIMSASTALGQVLAIVCLLLLLPRALPANRFDGGVP